MQEQKQYTKYLNGTLSTHKDLYSLITIENYNKKRFNKSSELTKTQEFLSKYKKYSLTRFNKIQSFLALFLMLHLTQNTLFLDLRRSKRENLGTLKIIYACKLQFEVLTGCWPLSDYILD